MRRLVGLVHRVVYASLISLVGLMSCVLPIADIGSRLGFLLCKVLNWPVGIIGQFIPGWVGINVVSARGGCEFCTPAERLQSHMALAIPLHVVLFYMPNVIMWIFRKRRARMKREAPLDMPRESANDM